MQKELNKNNLFTCTGLILVVFLLSFFPVKVNANITGTIPTTEAVPAITYLHNDIMGTPVAGTDKDGNILWQEQRRAYGQIAENSAKTKDKNIYSVGYTGHQEDNDSGLTYAKARYYNAEIGRFYAPDPIDFRTNDLSSINRYVYGANNPYMYTDPTGECNMGTDYGINCTSYALVQGADVARTASQEWGHGNYGTSMVGYALWVGNLANVAYSMVADTVMATGNATYNMTTGFTAGNYDQALLGSTELLLVGAGVKLTSVPAQAKATGDAAKGANLASNSRARHILFGDATGGGHKFGFSRLFNGKSKFPVTWNQDRILHAVSDIATDPNLNWVQQTGRAGSFFTRSGNPARFTVEGVRDGTRIRVVVEPAGEGIITAFPIK